MMSSCRSLHATHHPCPNMRKITDTVLIQKHLFQVLRKKRILNSALLYKIISSKCSANSPGQHPTFFAFHTLYSLLFPHGGRLPRELCRRHNLSVSLMLTSTQSLSPSSTGIHWYVVVLNMSFGTPLLQISSLMHSCMLACVHCA